MSAGHLESRSVHAPRRLSVLLASGAVALTFAGPALAGGRSDAPALAQVTGDAHGDSRTRSKDGDPARTTPPLTHQPRKSSPGRSDSSGSSGSGSGGDGPPTQHTREEVGDKGSPSKRWDASGTLATELPNTGADARVVGLLGLALMLLGIGLRLRIADARP